MRLYKLEDPMDLVDNLRLIGNYYMLQSQHILIRKQYLNNIITYGYDHLKNGFKNFDPSETAGDVYKNVNVDYKIPDNVN